jgi:hypothetical protein
MFDWRSQEFAIAAALSGDRRMQEAYRTGDPYLAFAKQAGAVPDDATKRSHADIRELFKIATLATQCGQEAYGLAARIGASPALGRELLQAHRETYRTFWKWSDRMVDYAVLNCVMQTVFGWTIHVGRDFNSRSLRNFPMQGNGAEMMANLATTAVLKTCFCGAKRSWSTGLQSVSRYHIMIVSLNGRGADLRLNGRNG